MTPAGQRMACAAAAALPLVLGGCIAAAVPIAAGAVVAGKASQKRHDRGAGPARPAPPAAIAPTRARAGTATADMPNARAVLLTDMKELPPPSAGDSYAAFAAFARDRAAAHSSAGGGNSVVLADGASLASPRFAACGTLAPAVVIDLDPGKATFDPAVPGEGRPGLPTELASLRAAGITVMWSSSLTVDKAQAVYDRLRESGLDPVGIDRVLLVRQADERKQLRRLAATRDWCVIAIAGDRDGDFDELFDYLRDPDYAAPLAFLKNAGWFLAPPPIQPIITEKPNP